MTTPTQPACPRCGAEAKGELTGTTFFACGSTIGGKVHAQLAESEQCLRNQRDQLCGELERVKEVCGDRYPDSVLLQKVHELRAELKETQRQNLVNKAEKESVQTDNEYLRAEVERLKADCVKAWHDGYAEALAYMAKERSMEGAP